MEKTTNTVEKFLEIEVREITVTRTDGSKNVFNAFKTYLKNGKKMDLKFTKDVKNIPNEDCLIKVNVDDMNIDRNRKYPVVWVKRIIEAMPKPTLTRTPADYKELDDSFCGKDDLPF